MVEAVSESSGLNPLHVALENHSMFRWHDAKCGIMVWNKDARPQGLPVGYDILDYHILKLEDRKAMPRVARAIISADTTPCIHWLCGAPTCNGPFKPENVYHMTKVCLNEKFWGVDLYPADFTKLDKASMKAAARALRETIGA
jgi:hypothetical protein